MLLVPQQFLPMEHFLHRRFQCFSLNMIGLKYYKHKPHVTIHVFIKFVMKCHDCDESWPLFVCSSKFMKKIKEFHQVRIDMFSWKISQERRFSFSFSSDWTLSASPLRQWCTQPHPGDRTLPHSDQWGRVWALGILWLQMCSLEQAWLWRTRQDL